MGPLKQTLKAIGRVLLFVLGLGLAAWLVRNVGVERVLTVLGDAKSYMPLIIGLEIMIVVTDVAAVRSMVGAAAQRVPMNAWIRSGAIAYAASILLPAGRAVGEAMRTRALAPTLGAPRAAAAASRLQACTLFANAVVSLCIAAETLAVNGPGPLALAMLLNAVLCGTIATLLYSLVKSKRFAAWLGRRFKKFVASYTVEDVEPPPRRAGLRGFGYCIVGRAFQAVQYGVAVRAVGGPWSPHLALSAQGIHLVGAAVGDMVPNQMGITEGAYRAFAHSLGFDAQPARALGIALLARIAQIGLAVTAMGVATLLARKSEKERPAGA